MKRCFFETPSGLAQALVRYAPRRVGRLLDPAVGEGALLEPFFEGGRKVDAITAVDVDGNRLVRTEARLKQLGKLDGIEFVQDDFLVWAEEEIKDRPERLFDCIVLNPPFLGRKEFWTGGRGNNGGKPQLMAAEAAFVSVSCDLLRDGGKLLAIVSGSIVGTNSNRWLREKLMALGAVQAVVEFPRFTFPGVESMVYLLVFERGRKLKSIDIARIGKNGRVSLKTEVNALGSELRWDYAYRISRNKYHGLLAANHFSWSPLGEVASILRGTVESPRGKRTGLHSTNFEQGFWRGGKPHSQSQSEAILAREGDLAIQRVGRSCVLSVGAVVDTDGINCSDCVLIIRPMKGIDPQALLFNVRVLFGVDWIKSLICRGTGANYIGAGRLAEIRVPSDLHALKGHEFALYRQCFSNEDFEGMCRIEEQVRDSVFADPFGFMGLPSTMANEKPLIPLKQQTDRI